MMTTKKFFKTESVKWILKCIHSKMQSDNNIFKDEDIYIALDMVLSDFKRVGICFIWSDANLVERYSSLLVSGACANILPGYILLEAGRESFTGSCLSKTAYRIYKIELEYYHKALDYL